MLQKKVMSMLDLKYHIRYPAVLIQELTDMSEIPGAKGDVKTCQLFMLLGFHLRDGS